ncbi:MAG: hypothetical protein JW888_10215, partial [Pirellulales bacterium]|nr:hypothetical protein [Pirellulales bacterium]
QCHPVDRRMAMRSTLFGLALLVGLCGTVFGNSGIFGGSGQRLQLIKSADVQMVSEDVTITPVCGANVVTHTVCFRCTFVLKNRSAKPVKIQVGFPLDRERAYKSSSQPFADDADKILSYHFIARDAKNTYHVRYVAKDPQGKFSHLFLWDMEFAPAETKTLHVGYILPMTINTTSTRKTAGTLNDMFSTKYERPWHWRIEQCLAVLFYYVTETGQSWVGPIEKATFCVRNEDFEYFVLTLPAFSGGGPGDVPRDEEVAEEDSASADAGQEDDGGDSDKRFFGTFYREISPDGWKSVYISKTPHGGARRNREPNSIMWEFKDYKADAPLIVAYYLIEFPEKTSDCVPWVRSILGKKPTKVDVLELRETVGAFYGIIPQTASVRRFVEQQIWYHPQKKLRESDLGKSRRAVLTRLKQIADRAASASSPSAEPPHSAPLVSYGNLGVEGMMTSNPFNPALVSQ